MHPVLQIQAELEAMIQKAYEEGTTIPDAEKNAAYCLVAQIRLSNYLSTISLDARMRKTGTKALRAAVYLGKAQSADKKPSDVMLQAFVDSDKIVIQQQEEFDRAEIETAEVDRLLKVAQEGHIYFRGISKQQGGF